MHCPPSHPCLCLCRTLGPNFPAARCRSDPKFYCYRSCSRARGVCVFCFYRTACDAFWCNTQQLFCAPGQADMNGFLWTWAWGPYFTTYKKSGTSSAELLISNCRPRCNLKSLAWLTRSFGYSQQLSWRSKNRRDVSSTRRTTASSKTKGKLLRLFVSNRKRSQPLRVALCVCVCVFAATDEGEGSAH